MRQKTLIVKALGLTLILLLLSGCGGPQPSPTPTSIPTLTPIPPTPTRVTPGIKPVVIDTDMAVDDWMAILYLLQRTDVAIKAITVTGTGEAHCEPGIRNALGLVALAGNDPIPVACGRETPLEGEHTFPQGWRERVDNLAGLSVPEGQNPAAGTTAVELLVSTIQSSPEKVTLLALGPLTNVAELLLGTPSVSENIERVFIMGGAVHVTGNLSSNVANNQAAEWNIYVDPHAANVVFEAGVPITLVPLDATNQALLTMDFYEQVQSKRATPEAKFVFDVLNKQMGFLKSGSWYFWDPLAAAVLTNESLSTYEQDALCVVEEEGPQSGQTQVVTGCPEIRVAIFVDKAQFEQVFLDTLNNP